MSTTKRDAFFKNEASSGGMREREKDQEKEVKSRLHTHSTKEIDGYVGFANLPNQVYRKSVKRGFEFTLMVVGECCVLSTVMFISCLVLILIIISGAL